MVKKRKKQTKRVRKDGKEKVTKSSKKDLKKTRKSTRQKMEKEKVANKKSKELIEKVLPKSTKESIERMITYGESLKERSKKVKTSIDTKKFMKLDWLNIKSAETRMIEELVNITDQQERMIEQQKSMIEQQNSMITHMELERKERVKGDNRNFYLSLVVVAVATISLLASLWIFRTDIDIQNQNDKTGLIWDMKSLEKEIEKNIEVIDTLSCASDDDSCLFRTVFFTGNIERTISDGRVRHERLKNRMMNRYSDLSQLQITLNIINSPEFQLLNTTDWTQRKLEHQQNALNQLNNIVRPALIIDNEILQEYIECLEKRSDIYGCIN